MAEICQIVIGIQARSTSKRFPRKVFEPIGGKPMIQHVIDSCRSAAEYTNHHSYKTRNIVSVALAVPYGDELVPAFRKLLPVIEGPEDDVLARYKYMADRLQADYVVRVTGDCPLLPPYLINHAIKCAVMNGYDYVSNVDERCRMVPDGYDVEVMSQKLLTWMHETAKTSQDREHVTTLARHAPPDWAKQGTITAALDRSEEKLSVDTPEDLDRVRLAWERKEGRRKAAENIFGRGKYHTV